MYADLYGAFIEETEGWDHVDEFNLQFYGAKLARDIGRFPKGSKVDCIVFQLISTDSPVIQIYDDRKNVESVVEYPVEFGFNLGEERVPQR